MYLNSAYIECINFLSTNGIKKPLSITLDLALKTNNDYSICYFIIELFEKSLFVKVTDNNFIHCEFYK